MTFFVVENVLAAYPINVGNDLNILKFEELLFKWPLPVNSYKGNSVVPLIYTHSVTLF